MDAIEFVVNYENYLTEIEQAVKPEYLPIIKELKEIDPHDLVRPESWFQSESEARGYVWSKFWRELKKG